jgi:predicted nucleotidyltransferase
MTESGVVEQAKARILAAFPAVQRIVLFGSRADGRATPDSDVDLLIVLDDEARPALRAARVRLALVGLPAAFDLVVLSPTEFRRSLKWRSSVVSTAVATGKVLHEAA